MFAGFMLVTDATDGLMQTGITFCEKQFSAEHKNTGNDKTNFFITFVKNIPVKVVFENCKSGRITNEK